MKAGTGFCNDKDSFFSGLQSVVGKDVPIIGGSTKGFGTTFNIFLPVIDEESSIEL